MQDIRRPKKIYHAMETDHVGEFLIPSDEIITIQTDISPKLKSFLASLEKISAKLFGQNKPDDFVVVHEVLSQTETSKNHHIFLQKGSPETKQSNRIKTKRTKIVNLKVGKEKLKKVGRTTINHARKHAVVLSISIINIALVVSFYSNINQKQQSFSANVSNSNQNTPLVLHNYLPLPSDAKTEAYKVNTDELNKENLQSSYWIAPWNLSDLQDQAREANSLSAFWLTVIDTDLTLQPKADWNNWQLFKNSLNNPNIELYLTVTGDPDITYLALTDANLQEKHISDLLNICRQQGFGGVDIDYEALGDENRDLFTQFIQNLAKAFHADNRKVAVTVEARIANQHPMDWRALSEATDELRVMAYDYHGRETGNPGPISPIGWIKEIADYCKNNLDSRKVVFGLGNYGYDWDKDESSDKWQGTGISFNRASDLLASNKAVLMRSAGIDERGYDVSNTPYFIYQGDDNLSHEVWFEDSASMQDKIALIRQYNFKGLTYWMVGVGDEKLWKK